MHLRKAQPEDAADMARIYNQGIAEGAATFETRPRTEADIRDWFDGAHPAVVVLEGDRVAAFAATFAYRPRACYAGIKMGRRLAAPLKEEAWTSRHSVCQHRGVQTG